MEEQKTHETEIRLSDLGAIFKRCWWQLLIVLVVVSMVLYIGMTATHEDEYTASVTIYVLVLPTSGGETLNPNYNSTAALQWATYLIHDCEILIRSHDKVLNPVIQEQGLNIDAQKMQKMIKIKRVSDEARVLNLSFTSKNARRSAEIVNALAEQACDYFNGMTNMQMLNVVDPADPDAPAEPSNPISMLRIMLLAFICAALVYAFHFLRFLLDDRINSAEDVEKYLGLSTLGVIPNKQDFGRRRMYGDPRVNAAGDERRKR